MVKLFTALAKTQVWSLALTLGAYTHLYLQLQEDVLPLVSTDACTHFKIPCPHSYMHTIKSKIRLKKSRCNGAEDGMWLSGRAHK